MLNDGMSVRAQEYKGNNGHENIRHQSHDDDENQKLWPA